MATRSPAMDKLNAWVTAHLTRVPMDEKILFIHNLQVMIKAGLSLVEALRVLGEQITNKKLRAAITVIKSVVEKGTEFSEALREHPSIFPEMYVSMIAAGETAGKLEESLEHVADQMKRGHELVSRIRGALIYPAVIVVAMVGIAIEMFVFVLPKIIGLFKDVHAQLPLSTRVLIAMVTFTQNYGVFLAIGTVLFIILAIWLYRKQKVKRVLHGVYLHLPIAGTIIKKINMAKFSMTLSSLLASTIPIIEALKITATVHGNLLYREHLQRVAETLKRGDPLSETLAKNSKLFTPMVIQMIMVGEQSGQVEHMLQELSEYYSNEVDVTMRNFSTIIEPVIILALGLAVAGLAVAVIMPIYSLAQSF